MDRTPAACLARARRSLDGLSVGDALGTTFFSRRAAIATRTLSPREVWPWTDDAIMAVSVVEELAATGDIDEGSLGVRFARRYAAEPWRGYGGTAHGILAELGQGVPWREAASRPFDGQGSKGNGAAMRVAPLGAYFAHDLDAVVAAAARSARPTHLHPEGVAGGVAIAVAAALAARAGAGELARDGATFLAAVHERTPAGAVRDGVGAAMTLPADTSVSAAAARLGNGARELADDTVALCLWVAARHLDDYAEAVWEALAAEGDMDTNCAIVGGIVAAGGADLPPAWLARREPLPPPLA
ncbi:MAG: ADP-ribosylglycohydrolase family protein [Myxococcales bacterium]|nr:ADP-ribosylglycohydrolase family protein [Myxococcales bacterium]